MEESKASRSASYYRQGVLAFLFLKLDRVVAGGPRGGHEGAARGNLTAMPEKRLLIIGYDVDKSIQVAKELKKFAD